MNERVTLLGYLEEARTKAERIRVHMTGLRDSIRGMLDKYRPIESIQAKEAAELALQLAALHEQYRETLDRIRALKLDLGME